MSGHAPGLPVPVAREVVQCGVRGRTLQGCEQIDGALPQGMIIDELGVVAGTPFETGAFSFTVEVTDSNCLPQRAAQSYALQVDELTTGGWEVQHSGNRILDIHFFDDTQGIAIGLSGVFYDTTDGGRCWTLRNPEALGSLWAFCWLGDEGWLSGSAGIAHSADRGQSWEIRNPDAYGMENGLVFVDSLHGVNCVGGGIRYTEDGGYTWNDAETPDESYYFSVGLKDAMTGWAGGPDKVFDKTTDGGKTWTPDPSLPWESLAGGGAASPDDTLASAPMMAVAAARDGRIRCLATQGGDARIRNDLRIPDVNGMCFVGDTGWIGAQGPGDYLPRRLFKTTNGGQSWTAQPLAITQGNYDEIQFLSDAQRGWASGLFNDSIQRTLDGGANWSVTSFRLNPTLMFIRGVQFLDDGLTGWAAVSVVGRTFIEPPYEVIVDNEGSIWKSINGGEAWDYQYGWPVRATRVDSTEIPDNDYYAPKFSHLQFLDEEHGWAIGAATYANERGYRIYRTRCGGARWELLSELRNLESAWFRTPDTGYALDGWPEHPPYETYDAGRTWRPRFDISVNGTTGTLLTGSSKWMSVHFIDDQVGWLVGYQMTNEFSTYGGRVVLRTDDGGRAWTRVFADADIASYYMAPLGLFFIDRQTGWMFNKNTSLLYRTDNGGETWATQDLGIYGVGVTDVHFVSPDKGFVLLAGGRLLTTHDGGAMWSPPLALTSGELHDIEMISCSRGWIGGEIPPFERAVATPLLYESRDGEFTTDSVTNLGLIGHSVQRFAVAESSNAWAVGAFGLCAKYAAPSGATVLTPSSLGAGRVGEAYAAQFGVVPANPAATYALCGGALPPGLTLEADGRLHGEPAAAATFRFLVSADVPGDVGAGRWFLLRIEPAQSPVIDTASLPDGTVAEDYAADLAASGTVAPYEWELASGSLPPGLNLLGYGVIAGVPAAPGLWTFELRVRDGQAPAGTASRTLSIQINGRFAGPSIQDLIDYLLKRHNDPTGLDVNADGAIDTADIIRLIAP